MPKLKTGDAERVTATLTPDQRIAVDFIAYRDGHDSLSRAIQDAISHEIHGRLGENWRPIVREWANARKDAA